MNRITLACGILTLLAAIPAPATAQEDVATQEPRIKLQLVDTDIRDALRLVAKQGGINIVMSNGVQGMISLELDDVSIRETLDAIVSVGGYSYTIQGNVVTVTSLAEELERDRLRAEVAPALPPEQEALVIELRYVDAERVKAVVEKMLNETGSVSILKTADQVAQDNRNQYGNNNSNQYGNAFGRGNSGGGNNGEGLQIATQLTSTSQGQPAQSHTLVVMDTQEKLAQVQRVVDRIDVKPPQVLIEARFVEVSLDDVDKMGIDWNMVASANGGSTPITFPFGDSTLGSYGPDTVGSTGSGAFPQAPNSVSTPSTAGLFTFGTLDFSAFSAVLQLIQTDSRVKIVSNPRIVVGDRHTATILVGERYPILSANISEFGTVTEQLDRYEPIGVQLEVTPAVLGDDEIELLVRPSTSSLGSLVSGSTGLTVARINSRQIDTSVTARDNQTVVLGGLFTTREVDETSGVPYVSRIPLVGRLFESETKSIERVDLVIFLTVTIVQDGGLTTSQRAMFEDSNLDETATRLGDRPQSALGFSSTGPKE